MSEEDINDWIPVLEEVVKAVEDVYRNLESLECTNISAGRIASGPGARAP